MDRDLHNDNLEDLFRKSLQEAEELPANDWDEPSEGVWSGIERTLRPDANNRRWIIGLILLLILAGASFFILDRKGDLQTITQNKSELPSTDRPATMENASVVNLTNDDRVEESFQKDSDQTIVKSSLKDQDLNERKTDKISENKPKIAGKLASEQTDLASGNDKRQIIEPGVNNSNQSEVSHLPTSNRLKDMPTEDGLLSNLDVITDSNPTAVELKAFDVPSAVVDMPAKSFSGNEVRSGNDLPSDLSHESGELLPDNKQIPMEAVKFTRYQPWLQSLTKMAISILSDETDNLNIPIYEYDKPDPIDEKEITPRLKTYLRAYYNPSLTYRVVNGSIPIRDDLVNISEQRGFSSSFGFDIGRDLGKNWFIEGGLGYRSSRINGDLNIEIPYTAVNERENPDGDFENSYKVSLVGSYGKYETDIALVRIRETDLVEGELIRLELRSSQRNSQLNFPIKVGYSLGKGALKFNLKTGVSTNVSLNAETTLTSVRSRRNGIRHGRSVVIDNNDSISSVHLAGLLSAGIDFSMSNKVGLFLDASFSQSITPYLKLEDAKIYPNSIGFNLGARINLN